VTKPRDLESLLIGLGIRGFGFASDWFTVAEKIEQLHTLGLIEVKRRAKTPIAPNDFHNTLFTEVSSLFSSVYVVPSEEVKKKPTAKMVFRLTDLALQLIQVLDISLSALSQYKRDQSIIVDPFFGVPSSPIKGSGEVSDIFVLMPFAAELKPVYEDHIKKVVADLKLRVKRADDLFSKDSVMKDIWNAINQATLIIADCTGRNPNVFYEIGIAHTINKPVILITQNENDVPFDLRHLRYIKYDYTPRGMDGFEGQLNSAISKILLREPLYIWQKESWEEES